MRTGRFTKEENELVRAMLRRGTTYEALQTKLNRTFESIRQRVIILRSVEDLPNINRKDYGSNGYSVADEAKIIAMYNAGYTMSAIAKAVGRSYGSLKDKVQRMRIAGADLKPRRTTGEKSNAVLLRRRHGVTVGNLPTLLFNAAEPVSPDAVDWMAKKAADGGYKSIGEWLIDEAVDRYFEEEAND